MHSFFLPGKKAGEMVECNNSYLTGVMIMK